ncbi:hypothetical protein WR25_02544 isoform A [Diploscapter pachys]|uniref:Uncharacterized protein n=1 Tax=Diploscapter pachys TaxID=2018661 RepID=A0A2A2KUH8_9BILA|nr:hypothetical protein WR25_02544 isoform A [Diploscapter pachys]
MSMKSALNNPDAFNKWMENEGIEFNEPPTQEAMKEESTSQSSGYYDVEKREFDREQLTVHKDQIDTQFKYLEYQRTMCNTRDSETCYTNKQFLSKEIAEAKRNLEREKLLAQKAQVEMQLKLLDIYQATCNTKDTEQYYIDDVIPSVRNASYCIPDVEMIIESARELVDQCEYEFDSDYKKVSDEICNFTMHACERALRDLDIGRHSITSRAVKSLMILSYGLTEERRKELLEALCNLEDAENELRELCKQIKSNVVRVSHNNKGLSQM